MKRRDFLKAVFSTALYFAARKVFPDQMADHSDVGLVRGKDYEKTVTEAIGLIGGIQKFVKPGDVVVVKPNIAWNSPPELKANTDPLIVRTIVHLCFQALASKISIHDAVFLKETSVNKYILESDVLINVPVAKHHSSSGLTIGMKNLMGITGDNRSRWHWQLHDAISDINIAVKSHITLVDATNIMLKNGPTGGSRSYLKRLDTIVASSNVASADAETALLFGIKPKSIGYIARAAEKGIGKIHDYSLSSLTL